MTARQRLNRWLRSVLFEYQRAFGSADPSDWTAFRTSSFASYKDRNGNEVTGIVMQRYSSGRWEYREATDAEKALYVSDSLG
jgi:hypothetical protein